ncbi:MAG: FHA domain-containing protein [Mycobacteriales bacterium]|nr:zinc-ribbon and FHA domain-containing protein [Frankia sp.]
MFCTRCGQQNPDDGSFCARCGAPLTRPAGDRPSETTSTIALSAVDIDHTPDDDPAGDDSAAIDALPEGSALLVVKRGPNAGSRFLLDKDVTTAGRHPESDIFLDDVTVSRRHAEFRRDARHAFTVADVGSLNGTYVNRERTDASALSGGDEVQIGKFRLVFFDSPRAAGTG